MSGLRAISPADDSTESHYVKSIRSVCSMHAIPVGSPQHLAAFLKSLDSDKLLAMEFWSMVARLSDESSGLSIPAMNGVVIEVVMQAVTGSSVAEMVAAGREPRRLVGELGCLLAGEDVNSPIELPPPEAPPTLAGAFDPRVGARDSKATDVDKLRADIEMLKAAFDAQFGAPAARHSAPFPVAQVEQVGPALSAPPQALTNVTAAVPLTEPVLTDSPTPHPETAPSAPKAQAGPTHHTVYAEAQALSSSLGTRWSDSAISPPISTILKGTPPTQVESESESQQSVTAITELSVPAIKEPGIAETHQQLIPPSASTAPSISKLTPLPRIQPPAVPVETKVLNPTQPDAATDLKPKLELKSIQTSSLHAIPVVETVPIAPQNSSKRILLGAALVLLVGVGLSVMWWLKPTSANPMNGTTSSASTGVASGSSPVPTATVQAPVPNLPKPSATTLNPGTSTRSTEKTPGKLAQQIAENNTESTSEPAKAGETVRNEKPQPTLSTLPVASTGNAVSATAAIAAPETKIVPPSPAPRLTSASATPAAAGDRTAPAPVVRVPPAELKTSVPQSVSSGIMEGAKIAGQNPIYPAFAKSAHISGSVVLHAMISKAGTVENLKVVSGPLTLQQSAVAAVKTWRYKPYLLNGEPTEVDTSIIVNFHLVD